MKPEYQRYLFTELMAAGAEFDIRPFGLRALNALRLEKNFGGWAREYRPIYTAYEAELGRFVALTKDADFIGKAAARDQKARRQDAPAQPDRRGAGRRRDRRRADLA